MLKMWFGESQLRPLTKLFMLSSAVNWIKVALFCENIEKKP
jgi:hypothetical protein